MRNVDAMHRWLLYGAFAFLCSAPSTTYAAQGEGPEGPGRPYRPGSVVRKQFKITVPAQDYDNSCRATVRLRFTQRDDQASVRSEIENEDCAASRGKYELRLRIKDASGERHTLSFSEDWSRENALPIETHKFYDIGDNVDLASIRLKASSCECTDKPAAPEQPQ